MGDNGGEGEGEGESCTGQPRGSTRQGRLARLPPYVRTQYRQALGARSRLPAPFSGDQDGGTQTRSRDVKLNRRPPPAKTPPGPRNLPTKHRRRPPPLAGLADSAGGEGGARGRRCTSGCTPRRGSTVPFHSSFSSLALVHPACACVCALLHVSRRVGVALTASMLSIKHRPGLRRHESRAKRPGPPAQLHHLQRAQGSLSLRLFPGSYREPAPGFCFAAAPRRRRTSAIRHATMDVIQGTGRIRRSGPLAGPPLLVASSTAITLARCCSGPA
jgi:hypothetical protein